LFAYALPGKLKARPVQQPATPALITEDRRYAVRITNKVKANYKILGVVGDRPSSFPRSCLKEQETKLWTPARTANI
jgi:hypothetical protein